MARSGKINGELSKIAYTVLLKDGHNKKYKSVLIESTAKLDSREIKITAEATFKRGEKIIENNPYYLLREIYELWNLRYLK
jgi:hypothetical protein